MAVYQLEQLDNNNYVGNLTHPIKTRLGDHKFSRHNFSRNALSVLVSIFMIQSAYAANTADEEVRPHIELETTQINVKRTPAATSATEDVKTNKQIVDNQIDSIQDLVRYNTDISVAEIGRYGNKGFAIRGVDGNRVALSLDGVSLPDRQVNEVFTRYGKMYEGRFSPDVEILSESRIQVGADSFQSGSGAVGGSVNYKTKDPSDLIEPDKQIGGYAKLGYSDRNEEFSKAMGLAGRNDKFEAIINYVRRDGHELKNHQMKKFDSAKLDPAYSFREDDDYYNTYPGESPLPDPLDYKTEAAIAKLYMHVNDDHRIGVQGIYQKRESLANNYSTTTEDFTNPPAKLGRDSSELKGAGINYRYAPLQSDYIDEIKSDISMQQIESIARTEIHRHRDGSYSWDQIDTRPQKDKVKQISIDAKLLPIETDRFGTHSIGVNTKYATVDHDLLLHAKSKNYDWYSDNYTIGKWDTFIGPAVKTNVFNLSISDSIKLTDKLRATLGLRYDNYNFKPHMTDAQLKSIEHYSGEAAVKQYYANGDFEKKRRMDNVGGMIALNYKFTPHWQVGYKYSTGFMVPSTSQMYSAFEILGNKLTPNPNLDPEQSKNHELTLATDYDTFSTSLTGFYTDYDDFIQFSNYPAPGRWPGSTINLIGAQNIGKAKTYGARLGGTWDISEIADIAGSLKLSGNVSYAKDKTDKGINLLATQPPGAQLGVQYESAAKDYQLNASMSYIGRKKAGDAKVFAETNRNPYSDPIYGIVPFDLIEHSKSKLVYDVYGSKKIRDNIKLSAGVYNVFDAKYIPWSNLRSLAEFSLNTMVGNDGTGIERYTAPGRNYKVGLTYEF
ncbi:TonB-dependent hemoglobin/transferrin/lactoferrin family receptor [Psychrobacter sp. FDAARGOS_221]|uniref:TonB-dependent hemoglobin/transferrin/lactoferrin family receptor n=1 Tax=Psychrobacter sp. FDAARGOS_221 TaxID=1975705 RepID=UPI000BB58503|nr:TonB-dependent hemoglobin/transferrin/lactoferrin family receptor [Psychrobacter sp. FDAARGOS_221]PNK59784.1 TonB-dependent hemoglobin/transferrin/lactoferrin family receptor [Psychrobacter sp. FDAARGOS_221]